MNLIYCTSVYPSAEYAVKSLQKKQAQSENGISTSAEGGFRVPWSLRAYSMVKKKIVTKINFMEQNLAYNVLY